MLVRILLPTYICPWISRDQPDNQAKNETGNQLPFEDNSFDIGPELDFDFEFEIN